MEEVGVAHRYLYYSIRRHLTSRHWDAEGARRLGWVAARISPLSLPSYGYLLMSLVPGRLYRAAAGVKRRLQERLAHG